MPSPNVQYLTILKDAGENLQGDGRGKALLAISAGSFLLIGVQMIYPVLVPELRAAYGLSLTTAGMLLSSLWIANATGQLPGGMLADRLGEGRTLVVGVLVSAATLLLIITVSSPFMLFVATVLFGLGIALYSVARYTATHGLYPDQAGTTIGIVLASADAGQALLPPVASFLGVAIAWQLGFGFTIPIFALVAVGLWLYAPPRTSTGTSDTGTLSVDSVRTILRGMRTRSIGFVTIIFIVYVNVWVAFTSFYPTYLTEIKELSPTLAAVLFGVFFAVGVVTKPLSGIAYDRIGIRFSLLAISLVSGIALAVLPLVEGAVPLAVVTVFIAPILGSGTISQSHLIDELASDVRGTGLGVVRTGGMAIAALNPTLFGAAADRGFFDEMFLALAGLAALMIVLAVQTR